MISSKLLVTGTLLFFFLVLVFVSYHSTQYVPTLPIITDHRNNIEESAAHHSEENWYLNAPKTTSDFFKYLHWPNFEACEVAMDFGGHVYKGGSFTGMDGQKSICLDRGVAPKPARCVVYSFGINNDWSFDDTIADYGCNVYAFDPSMSTADHNRSAKIAFFRTGIATEDIEKDGRGWKMRTFSTLKRELGHDVVDVLKIDVEGGEWAVLTQLVQQGALEKVKQLAVEIHVQRQRNIESYVRKYWSVLSSVERAGLVRFSSKVNPWMKTHIAELGTSDYMGYEIAWLNPKFKN